ncbi:phosphatase PAP2 family protein [Enterococcus malodoratus]|uniref:phosphatase PAP2 family protein n=1 Tax=Enterococcus malodoratus TaxID=71451 RepID=UPI003FD22176
MKEKKKALHLPIGLFLFFILYTICLKMIDVQQIGPRHSEVGFATINQFFSSMIGTHSFWYQLTEILGIFPLLLMGYFALRGFLQLCIRKKISLIDQEILGLGFLYAAIAGFYIFFEKVVINYRPILVEGQLEASYPSSHTFLAVSVLLSAFFLLSKEEGILKKYLSYLCIIGMVALVIGRILSGVHWITDIFGGTVLGLSLVQFYLVLFVRKLRIKKER